MEIRCTEKEIIQHEVRLLIVKKLTLLIFFSFFSFSGSSISESAGIREVKPLVAGGFWSLTTGVDAAGASTGSLPEACCSAFFAFLASRFFFILRAALDELAAADAVKIIQSKLIILETCKESDEEIKWTTHEFLLACEVVLLHVI